MADATYNQLELIFCATWRPNQRCEARSRLKMNEKTKSTCTRWVTEIKDGHSGSDDVGSNLGIACSVEKRQVCGVCSTLK